MQLYSVLLLELFVLSAGLFRKLSGEETSYEEDYESDVKSSTPIDGYDEVDYESSSELEYPDKSLRSKLPTTNLWSHVSNTTTQKVPTTTPKLTTPALKLTTTAQKYGKQLNAIKKLGSQLKRMEPRRKPSRLPLIEAHTIKSVNAYSCPDSETSLTVGRFTIPTARDMLVITKRIIIKYFNIHQKKATLFLNEMRQASIALQSRIPYCFGIKRKWYKRCIKHVKSVSETITKNMLLDLERRRQEVHNYTSDKNCDEASLKEPSLNLLKWLAMENVSMDFALPAFLRVVYACTVHCSRNVHPPEKAIYFKDENLSNMIWAVKNHFKKREFKSTNRSKEYGPI